MKPESSEDRIRSRLMGKNIGDRYDVGEKIGGGAFGLVFLGIDRFNKDELVAIKVVNLHSIQEIKD